MKIGIAFVFFTLLFGCTGEGKYDVQNYYARAEQDSLLTSIVAYIYTPPPYTSMNDRFKLAHRKYYASQLSAFSVCNYYQAPDGKNYFFVLRPSSNANEKRGVGGFFKIKDNFELYQFREVFVTPEMPEEELKTKGAFLFRKMVDGTIVEYLKMKSYVQWPNEISTYDSITHQWSLPDEMK